MTLVNSIKTGSVQSEWLRSQVMDETESDIFLIVTASPFIGIDRIAGDSIRPITRKLILNLINEKQKYFLIISGEIHFGEITQLGFEKRRDDPSDLYEVVSSGLTHTTQFNPAIPNFVIDSFNVKEFK